MFRYNEAYQDLEMSPRPARKDFRPVGDFLDTILKNCGFEDSFKRSSAAFFKSGFADLDFLIGGGFRSESLNILAAGPAMGKTSLALNIAQFGGGESDSPVLIFSLELSDEQVVQRMLASRAGISLDSMNSGTMKRSDWDTLTNAAGSLMRQPIFIDDSSRLTTMDFRSRCHQFKEKYPNLGLIVVDYIQLMTWEKQAVDKKREVMEVLKALKETAVDLDCPILAISQLLRKSCKGISTYSDLYDIPEDALDRFSDMVMFLRRDNFVEANPSSNSKTLLSLMKGKDGRMVEISLIFNREILRFCDKEQM